MRLPFGFQLTKAAPPTVSSVPSGRGWWPIIRERWGGAWQQNLDWTADTILAHHAVWTCITLIANDIGKLRPKLMELDANGIWTETSSPAFSPVLRKPNAYQNRIQFFEWWMISKLSRGNTYILKERDDRGIVQKLYCLDPTRVTVLVATNGAVFYRLNDDNLSGIEEAVTVPASEIIHDRFNCLFHPLVGLPPIFASAVAANIGLKIQDNSTGFFGNGSNPSGILSTVTSITPEKSKQLSEIWNEQFKGDNAGRVAVLGDGMKFDPLRMTAVDSQLIEHLKWSAETVASTFHVPAFKIGIGAMPTYQNGEILNGIYYSDCLQSHIEQVELCLDEGLGIGVGATKEGTTYGTEFDLDALLRMDTATQLSALKEGVSGGIVAPNEARKKLDLKPVKGGDTPYLQQQNFALSALAERDEAGPPPNTPGDRRAPAAPAPAPPPEPAKAEPTSSAAMRRAMVELYAKAIAA